MLRCRHPERAPRARRVIAVKPARARVDAYTMVRRPAHGRALPGLRPVLVEPAPTPAPLAPAAPAVAARRLLAFVAVFAVCAVGLWVLHERTRPHYRLSAAAAVVAAEANARDRAFLAHHPTSGARVIPLDATTQRVTFFDGPRVVLDAAVGPRGEVVAVERHLPGVPASGAAVANSGWLLALLTLVFLLATLVVPLWHVRNLDALVLASLTLTVPLIDARLVAASVACAEAALCYLLARCLAIGLRPARPTTTATPLLRWLWAEWEPRRRTRMLRLILFATALAFVAVTLTSAGYTDVAFASMEGATDVLHGVLPYGHIDLAFHGDTYPLLNYLLYVPAAVWLPVSEPFSDPSGSLVTAAAASLLTGWALYRVAASRALDGSPAPTLGSGPCEPTADPGPHGPAADRCWQEPPTDRGLRAALAWLAFPPVLLAASGGANDLVLAACLAWALALRTRVGASLAALAAGVWVKLVPVVLLAIWVPWRRRGLARALAAALALSAALAGLLVLLGGPGAFAAMVRAIAFQFQRGSFYAPWYTFHVQWLQPLVQAGVLTMVLAAALRVRADSSIRADPVRLGALAAALLLGAQVAANYWTWSYLPWVFPFLAIALLVAPCGDPGHSDRRAEGGWVHV